MPALTKLVLLSSAMHQLAFTLGSTLPFAIGQVQDAGLILLSKITTNIAARLAGEPDAVIVSTAVTVTALATAVLGLCLVVIGKLKLARFVAFLPMPVVGG
jgi:sulfate permease, SulP family